MTKPTNSFNVSRETLNIFQQYKELLTLWNKKTKLVQEKTLEYFMERHIYDSLQLLNYISLDEKILDLGSGAGFPAVPLNICGVTTISLVESSYYKTLFLEELKRILNLNYTILRSRIEELPIQEVDVVTSRACADLSHLFEYTNLVSRETKMVFLKGSLTIENEILEAEKKWSFNFDIFPSETSKEGVVIVVKNLKQKEK